MAPRIAVEYRIKALMVFLILTLSFDAYSLDEEFKYQLGGALPFASGATSNNASSFTVGIEWNTDLTCGNFDIQTSIENQINGISGYIDNLYNNIINGLTAFIGQQLALAIQRLNPALYDLLQNNLLQATAEFNYSKASCKQIADAMTQAAEEDAWSEVAESNYWATQSNTNNTDILESEEEAETVGLDNGVPWIGGSRAGGQSPQAPIEINSDVAKAGYGLLVGSKPCVESGLCVEFQNADNTAAFVVEVLGDKTIRTCQGCEKVEATAGIGLMGKTENLAADVDTVLGDMLALGINAARLNMVPGISRPLIEALAEEEEPRILSKRLASEYAFETVMNRALLARRALAAGMKEPNVAANKIAQEEIRHTLEELNDEITNAESEMNIRAKMVSTTAVALLQRQRIRNKAAVVESPAEDNLRDGALR